LFGEMNVFSPPEVREIVVRAQAMLAPRQGKLIVEMQTPEAVQELGRSQPCEEQYSSGLFSDHPYGCRTEHQWLPEPGVAVQTFTVDDCFSGETRVYRNTTKAWNIDELECLLTSAGFCGVSQRLDWPCNTRDLALWSAGTG
jgi:hypothetical protein